MTPDPRYLPTHMPVGGIISPLAQTTTPASVIINREWDKPYRGEWDSDSQCYIIPPHLEGKTLREAMIIQQIYQAAAGAGKAFDRLHDRTEGKPMQSTQNLNVNTDADELVKLLRGMHEEEFGQTIDVAADTTHDSEDLIDELFG